MRFVVYESQRATIATTIIRPALVLLAGAMAMALMGAVGSVF